MTPKTTKANDGLKELKIDYFTMSEIKSYLHYCGFDTSIKNVIRHLFLEDKEYHINYHDKSIIINL